tara:strand:- start:15304 stop:16209 length:906 start_codon:yes stop_codon:yes gene_type:complete
MVLSLEVILPQHLVRLRPSRIEGHVRQQHSIADLLPSEEREIWDKKGGEKSNGGQSSLHVSMGDFYEALDICLYGGMSGRTYHVALIDAYGRPAKVNGKPTREVKPDIYDPDHKEFRELKACNSTHSFNILDEQMMGYCGLQNLKPDHTIYFTIYRQGFQGIKSAEITEPELFKELSESTTYSVTLPLSVIIALHKLGRTRDPGLVRRYEKPRIEKPGVKLYQDCTVIHTTTIDALMSTPEEILTELKLHPGSYFIERVLSPRRITISGNHISPFPILKIEDRDHQAWLESFMPPNQAEIF